MPYLKSILWVCLSVFCLTNTYAQRERDTIKPEKLIITKQYNPSVNDAFKIKKKPKLTDSILPKAKELNYAILEVPVASAFTPAKGSASGLRLQPDNVDSFTNYARVGAGNFTSILAEFFSELELNEYQKLNLGLSHFSSQGGIDEVEFDDNFAMNALQLKFTAKEKGFVWKLNGGLSYNAYNYYGIPDNFMPPTDSDIGDLSQHYLGFNVGGGLEFYDAAFKQVHLDFTTFSDNFNSQESRFVVQPQVDFFIREQRIENFFKFDYLAGQYDNQTVGIYNYAWMVTAYNPNIQINEDRFSIKLGAEFTYLSDIENSDGSFYVYPKVEGSYRIKQDNLIAFGGVDGGLDQNSYQQFSNLNPFIAPISAIAPTNRQYDAYLGLKGGSYAWGYSAKMSYRSQENNPFFSKLISTNLSSVESFTNNNAFGIVYSDLKTTALDVEIDYSLNKKLNIGVLANLSSFNVDDIEAAWNLPNTTASVYGNYKMNDKWSFATSVFYVGEREDILIPSAVEPPLNGEIISLSSFVDANFSVQYKINPQLHAFVDAKNLFGGNYERWLNYPVQGLQILGGLSFQFDW